MRRAVRFYSLLFSLTLLLAAAGCHYVTRTAPPKAAVTPVAPQPARRADWMQKARWGVMTHYLSDWQSRGEGTPMTVEKWNRMIDNFDVEGLADQLKSVGAGWYQITIGQNSGYFLCPNETYDKLTGIKPSKCSRRDLVSDLADALKKRGIRLMVYLPSGAPAGDRAACAALQWQNGPYRNAEFQKKWEAIIADWSKRWGDKVSGWWFDGCYWPNAMYRYNEGPNFASFAAAARAGNPNSCVAFNPGVIDRAHTVDPEEDFTAGEINNLDWMMIRRAVNGFVDGAQVQFLTFLGQTWGTGPELRFTTEQAVTYSRKIGGQRGVVTWDVPIQKSGRIAPVFVDQLKAIGAAMHQVKPGSEPSLTSDAPLPK